MDQNTVTTNVAVPDPNAASSNDVRTGNAMVEVASKVLESKNVLVALSNDPSVDEMAAAIGLTICLDRLGKQATAIYSGSTPNALEFLEPEKTFETTTDSLQDFVIALNKEKADHLRYKLDGEYVKIYITPYRTRIDSSDLEFSYGDYNVDLVVALDVVDGADLDSALREHGRIMHDATVINISTGNPGKFGEIEWNDKGASSVSEMLAKLLYSMGGEVTIAKEDATAFLTGIVAATNRFSNAKTTPDTMRITSRLMESGANQQLVSKNVTLDVDNELYEPRGEVAKETPVPTSEPAPEDLTKLNISHDEVGQGSGLENVSQGETVSAESNSKVGAQDVAEAVSGNGNEAVAQDVVEKTVDESDTVAKNVAGPVNAGEAIVQDVAEPESDLMKDLREAAANLAHAGDEAVPESAAQPVKLEKNSETAEELESELNADLSTEVASSVDNSVIASAPSNDGTNPGEPMLPPVMSPDGSQGFGSELGDIGGTNETQHSGVGQNNNDVIFDSSAKKVIQPLAETGTAASGLNTLTNIGVPGEALGTMPGAVAPNADMASMGSNFSAIAGGANPAAMMTPQVASAPEINGVPEMNYMPLPGQEILPPPPAPPIDMNSVGVANVGASASSTAGGIVGQSGNVVTSTGAGALGNTTAPGAVAQPTSLGPQPAMQDQVYNSQANDPSAFKIPGM